MFIFYFFLPEIDCIIRMLNILIRFRIEIIIVNAINDTAQVVRSGAEQAV